ncbi:MAG: hypothetical protein AABX77_02310 [Nanoarchaeota archaeon]
MKKLNFCCGNDIRKDLDNHDIQEKEGILSFDADKFPYPIKDNTYDYIYKLWGICYSAVKNDI